MIPSESLKRTRVVFLGSPPFAIPSLEALQAATTKLTAVVTRQDKPAGRGKKITAPAVKIWAEKKKVPVYQPQKLRDPRNYAFLEKLRPDLLVVVAYGEILPREVLDIAKYGAINVHPSLLPKYRGPAPIPAAILNGEKETGVTIILLEEEVDSGPILAQEGVRIADNDTAETLSEKLASKGAKLLITTLERWIKKEIIPSPQDHTKATFCKRIKKEDGQITWSNPAEEIVRMARAYTPWPGIWTEWVREKNESAAVTRLRLKVISVAEQSLINLSAQPGEVYRCNEDKIAIRCGKKSAIILEVIQPQDRSPMDIQAFVRGHQTFIGSRLGTRKSPTA